MNICDSNAFVIGMQLREFRILCDLFSAQNKQMLVTFARSGTDL